MQKAVKNRILTVRSSPYKNYDEPEEAGKRKIF